MAAEHRIVIVGAGPAGLTAAYMLSKRGVASTVLEIGLLDDPSVVEAGAQPHPNQ